MKPTLRSTIGASPLAVWLAFLQVQSSFAALGDGASTSEPARASEPIPWSEIGTKATAQYAGEGLSISAVEGGAVLRCLFQRMNARATAEGLWITSTVDGAKGEPFRVVAVAVGREGGSERAQPYPREPQPRYSQTRLSALRALPATGTVEVAEKLARCVRPGVVEEYSVSVDGVRQDLMISEKPDASGELRVELDVSGARAEALGCPNAGSGDPAYMDPVGRVPSRGARLLLKNAGRKIPYSPLRVTDATGKELTARMEVEADGAQHSPVLRSNSAEGGRRCDEQETVRTRNFLDIVAGNVIANRIAKWNGSSWSPVGERAVGDGRRIQSDAGHWPGGARRAAGTGAAGKSIGAGLRN